MSPTPEQQAREHIDVALEGAGWVVQDFAELNLSAGNGVAVREFPMAQGHGRADYLLFVDGKAVGVLEAKPAGHTLEGVEPQTQKYATGLPAGLNPPVEPLPFVYVSTGAITKFTNLLDLEPKSRGVYRIHRPELMAEWLKAETLDGWLRSLRKEGAAVSDGADDTRPSSFGSRISTLKPIEPGDPWTRFLYPNQIEGVNRLEQSLKRNRRKALVQMATGSGKTIFAISSIYRLIKYAGARRVLFLVDRTNLGEQAEKAFQGYRTPDDNRKFTDLYNVQRLTTNTIGASTKVVVTTIQRLYSMLEGEPDMDPELEARSGFDDDAGPGVAGTFKESLPVVYSPVYPPGYFDLVFIDECHRSIYTLWRQVLDYFDAFLVGLTATPAKQTFGFFEKNLVMEYGHERAVADRVNVGFEVYSIRTRITEQGSVIEAKDDPMVGYRSRETRTVRWEKPDEDISYKDTDLDRLVVAKDQIRLIVRTFRDRLFTEIFPGRKHVPKTLVFAKDDSHAEDIVGIIRDEFGHGNDFCKKITYKVTGAKPADLIQEFRNSYNPRIVVTVDMVATGTDIRPIEIVWFLRRVKSRVLWEQMKGRGVRIVNPAELKAVTPDAPAKTHFVLVDCVGMVDAKLDDSQPLERKKSVPLKALLDHVAMGGTDPDMLSSLASRLLRTAAQCGPAQHHQVEETSGGASLVGLASDILEALDPDVQAERARQDFDLPPEAEPTEEQLQAAHEALTKKAVEPIATKPKLRQALLEVKRQVEQIIDEVSVDDLLFAGVSEEAQEKAKTLVTDFETFIEENKDEITALQFFYSVPHRRRLRFKDIKALVEAIQAPPRSWTPEQLWRAYEMVEKDKVRGASAKRMLTDVVSLVRFALHRDEELVPYPEQVKERFQNWLAQQANRGRSFTAEQVHWLEMMRDHIASSLEIDIDTFDYTPFVTEGGLGKARRVFGKELGKVLEELNEVLAA